LPVQTAPDGITPRSIVRRLAGHAPLRCPSVGLPQLGFRLGHQFGPYGI
jgi:hypothetical protein